MILIEENTVPDAALPVARFKAHLRLGTGFGEDGIQDGILNGFLRAAIASIEARTSKILIERAFSWTLHHWRDPAGQNLPVSPVVSVSAVTMIDRLGAESVLPEQDYRLERDAQRPVLRPTASRLPFIPTGGSVRIGLVAGFAPDWDGLPADLGQAVLLLATHYYEYRDETTLSEGCTPFGVSSLIERYRPMRIYAGRAQ